MTTIERSALVRFSARSMFKLVDDIEAYPEFLPWCSGSRVLQRSDDFVDAELEIARGGFRKSFATRNKVSASGEEIRMSLLNGPFSSLEGVWKFVPLREDASKVCLKLDFELASRLGGLAFGTMFSQICSSMVSAFSNRAKEIYGRKK